MDEYKRGIEDVQISIIGRILIKRGESLPTNMAFKVELEAILRVNNIIIIPLG